MCGVIFFADGVGVTESMCITKESGKLDSACNPSDRHLPVIARKALKLGKT